MPCAKSKTLSTCSKGLKGYPNSPVNGGGGLNKMYLQRGLATPKGIQLTKSQHYILSKSALPRRSLIYVGLAPNQKQEAELTILCPTRRRSYYFPRPQGNQSGLDLGNPNLAVPLSYPSSHPGGLRGTFSGTYRRNIYVLVGQEAGEML